MILEIPSGESYSGIRALADLFVCVKYTNKLSDAVAYQTVAELTSSLAWYFIFYSFFYFTFSFSMDSSPIYQYAKPRSASLEPPKSLEPILTPGYKPCPSFTKLIREKSFSREGDENPYSHLQEFEQIYACLRIVGMSDKTLRWNLFPFSLMGRAKY